MSQSRLRSPASTCASKAPALAVTSAQPSVELTSPTTTTTSGRNCPASGSNAAITLPVCTAWLAEPTWRK
jgi:hypothetical protein